MMNEQQYDVIMAKIGGLVDAKPNTPEEAELARLSELVEKYEDEHYPIEEPELPPGGKFLTEVEPSKEAVIQGLRELSWVLFPHGRRVVERAIERIEREKAADD